VIQVDFPHRGRLDGALCQGHARAGCLRLHVLSTSPGGVTRSGMALVSRHRRLGLRRIEIRCALIREVRSC